MNTIDENGPVQASENFEAGRFRPYLSTKLMQTPTDFDLIGIFNWIASRLVYIAIVLFLFFGNAVAAIFRTNATTLPWYKESIVSFFSISIFTALLGKVMIWANFDAWTMCVISGFAGIGCRQATLWMMDIWQQSKGFADLANKLSRIALAVRRAMNDNQPPTTPAP